jgi:hypothetical protein
MTRGLGLGLVLIGRLTRAACGDGVIDPEEQCDLGDTNGAAGACCTSTCSFAPLTTVCRPGTGVCDPTEHCPADADTCPVDDIAPPGSACDDLDPRTHDDACTDGVCRGTPSVCGDGHVDPGEVCDDGPANGSPGSCCLQECTPREYGAVCADEGDLCTNDTCDTWGTCVHVDEPALGCSTPMTPRASTLKIRLRPERATGKLSFKWRGGPALSEETVGNLAAVPSGVCVYDQEGGHYRVVYHGSASALAGAWTSTKSGWRFRSSSNLPDGINDVDIQQSSVFAKFALRVMSRGRLALEPLPVERRRRVTVQFRTAAGACWSASFSNTEWNEAERVVAKSEDTSLADANGNGVREWMVIGDSNTKFYGCMYPEQYALRHPSIVVWNEAIFGSAAFGWVRDDLLPALLAAHQPDAVLIALGTNDLSTRSSDQVVADLKTLHDQVARFSLANRAHPVPYLATIPPVYPRLETGLEPKITAVNVALRRSMPENVVDFDSWMPPDWEPGIMSWEGDGVHLGCLGHRRRAEVLEVMAGN